MAKLSRTKEAREPSDPLAELQSNCLFQLAGLLRHRPYDEKNDAEALEVWFKDQEAKVAGFPADLHRATLAKFFRMPSKLCKAHLGLNEALIWWCYVQLMRECSTCVTRIRAYCEEFTAECKPDVRDFANRITGIQSLYMADFPKRYRHVPKEYRFPELASGCPACVLSVIGARPDLLVALRANMLARSRHRFPRLLKLIDAWAVVIGTDGLEKIVSDSTDLADKLFSVRMKMREVREMRLAEESPEQHKRREDTGRKVKSSSHRAGEPAGLMRDKDDAASIATTLYPRLDADVRVPAGVNPQVMTPVASGRVAVSDAPVSQYTPSALAEGYDGRGGFCEGYGMKRCGGLQSSQSLTCQPGSSGAPPVGQAQAKLPTHRSVHDAAPEGRDASQGFDHASAIPVPLNIRGMTRNQAAKKDGAGDRPTVPRGHSRRPGSSVSSYVPVRQSWKASKESQTNGQNRTVETNPFGEFNPFDDDGSDVSDLEDEDQLPDNDYETEIVQSTVAPRGPPPERNEAARAMPNNRPLTTVLEVVDIDGIVSCDQDDVRQGPPYTAPGAPEIDAVAASSVYSSFPRNPPSSVGPPRLPFANPFADSAAVTGRSGQRNRVVVASSHIAPGLGDYAQQDEPQRLPTPAEYTSGHAAVLNYLQRMDIDSGEDPVVAVATPTPPPKDYKPGAPVMVLPDDSASMVVQRAARDALVELNAAKKELLRMKAQQEKRTSRRAPASARREPNRAGRQGARRAAVGGASEAGTEWVDFYRTAR
ncbi:hypothetical protein GQ53DRAFT_834427 [Thozetella sp. PMI_491]|nr:hypothetical protein GQ53DRAFT_834427 [Thozetella sp. PMI_491]